MTTREIDELSKWSKENRWKMTAHQEPQVIVEAKIETGFPLVYYRNPPSVKVQLFIKLCQSLKVATGAKDDESFVWTATLQKCFLRSAKNSGIKIHSQKDPSGGYRIWRTA